jgi:hypothetical protein
LANSDTSLVGQSLLEIPQVDDRINLLLLIGSMLLVLIFIISLKIYRSDKEREESQKNSE